MDQLAERVAAALQEQGWCVVDDALPAPVVTALAGECGEQGSGAFTPAGTGRRDGYHHDVHVRSDTVRWIDASLPAGEDYLRLMDSLRGALNGRLFLGLFDYECHYARYAPGACYRRHMDAFAGEKNRVLSTVLYLNKDWRKEQGGALLIHTGDDACETVLPEQNRLVMFLSERFPHEVQPATRERHSIAGWFRVRA